LAKKQSLTNSGTIGLVLWLLAGCASLNGQGSGDDATRLISFFCEDPRAKTVCIVGSFNAWTAGANPLVKVGQGEWKGTLRLPKGTYQYMFVVDGKTWVMDPKANRTLEDGFGRINGLFVVD
jgi:1,4-alpha-glucan branching enzyme